MATKVWTPSRQEIGLGRRRKKDLFDALVSKGLELEEQGEYVKARVHYMNSVPKVKDKSFKKWFRDRNKRIKGR